MRQKGKRLLSMCLCILLVLTAVPITASAGNTPFIKLEIREGSLSGAVVADLLTGTSDWKLETGKDYYLYGEVKKTADSDYLKIRFGNEDGTYNGITFFNPPGGTYTASTTQKIEHDYLDYLVSYDNYTEPVYGSNNAKLSLQDGVMIYHIKSDVAENSVINFAMGMVINDAVFSGAEVLSNAVEVAVGNQSGDTFNTVESKTFDISMKAKAAMKGYYNGTSVSATLNGTGAPLSFYIMEKDKQKPVSVLYEKVEFDITYPANAQLGNVGFNNSSYPRTNSTYGTMSVGTPVVSGDTQTIHVTIDQGYKKANNGIYVYYYLNFASPDYQDGDTAKTTVSNIRFTMKDGTVCQAENVSASGTYTILDSNKDNTVMSAINRDEVYNHTYDSAEPYNVSLGSAYILNKSVSAATPKEKTYEASFNTTNTAAVISKITVPVGTNTAPDILLTGKDAGGNSVSVTVSSPESYAYSGSSKTTMEKATYLLFTASDFGMQTFTGVKADIGKIKANYTTSGWTSGWSFDYNRAGAFGYFTTDETGIQVKNTFRLYNTDPAYRDLANGDLVVYTTATSTTTARVGFNSDNASIKNASGKVVDSVAAGEKVVVSGRVYPYSVPRAEKKGTLYGNTSYIKNPVIYLTLPQGLTVDSMTFKIGSTVLSHQVDNISYLNKTGDGVALYKVTFPEGTNLGNYNEAGISNALTYSVTFQTSKSLATKRYEINKLIGISAENPVEGMPYNNNPASLNTVMTDTYGINGGLDYSGVTKGTEQPGFGVQQLAEINVYNAVSVTNINGMAVDEEWYAYDASNPNSIASLGKNSRGRFRLKIENTSDASASDLKILVPIPKKDTDLGDVFMNAAAQFDMNITFDEAEFTAQGFQVSYVSAAARDTLESEFSYTSATSDSANAILLTCDSIPGKSNYELYFDFTVKDGSAKAQNIWRNAFYYTTSDNETQYKQGSYVASEVAGGEISGIVYRDNNRNGVQDSGEPGVAGVTVVVKDSSKKILSAETDENGYYSFMAVREDTVDITFSIPAEKGLRFNVEGDGVNTVKPAEDGLSAGISFTAAASNRIDAGVSGFYSLSYHKNSGSGSLPETKEYVENAQATVSVKPDNLLRTGYVFKEWNTKADGTGTGYQPGETFIINEDTTLYAIWELGTYTIRFQYRGATGGNDLTEKQLVHNQTYNTGGALPVPTKTGYTFSGWCRTSTGTSANVYNTSRFTLGADTTLYAIWTAKTGYTVSYATGGGTAIADRTVAWDDTLLPETVPVRAGYTFSGWLCNGQNVDEQTTFSALAQSDAADTSLTLTAQWIAKSGYTVKYDLDGGSGTGDYTDRSVNWAETGLLPTVNPTKSGYAFAGWYYNSTIVDTAASYGELAGTDDVTEITLTVNWVGVADNTVQYDTGGGTSYSDKTGVTDESTGLIPAKTPVRAGYAFAGWYYGSTIVDENTVYSSLTSDTTIVLTAKWTEKSYGITYDVAGISGISKKWSDSNLIPDTEPTRAGYTFAGWYYGTTKVEAATTVAQLIPSDQTDSLTLQAAWTESVYTVVYESDGGTYFSPKTNVKYSATGILPDATPVKTGYTFEGWYAQGTPVTSATSCGSLVTGEETTVTLTAKWVAKTGYNVVYNSGGGTEVESRTGVSWTDADLLPATNPTRTGYTFSKWVCGRNGVSATHTYGSLASTDTPGSSITLVAQWVNTPYTVNYDTGEGSAVASKTVSWGSSNLLPSQNVYREGYSLTGWTYNEEEVTTATLYSDLAADDATAAITLTAVYEPVANDYQGMGTDVQGRVVEGAQGPVYKIDLAWGAMKLEFSTQKGWDPETHTYSTGIQGYWSSESFDGENNKIVAVNHSNADVEVDFVVTKVNDSVDVGDGETEDSVMSASDPFENVAMSVRQENTDAAMKAQGVFLAKVPAVGAAAPEISAYLRVLGEPDNISVLNMDSYENIAVITVTIKALGGEITPNE